MILSFAFYFKYLGALIMEALEEALQQLVGVVDPLGVLANNPDHGSSSVRLVQRIQVLTERGDDAFIPEGQGTDVSYTVREGVHLI